jgi:hypothetical protein
MTSAGAAVLATVVLAAAAPIAVARDRGPLAGPIATGPVSDGEHAAAWQPTADRVTVLDTRTDTAVTRVLPAGCELGDIRRHTILLSCPAPGHLVGVYRPVLMEVATGAVQEISGWDQTLGVGSVFPPTFVRWTDLGRLYVGGLVDHGEYAGFAVVARRPGIPPGKVVMGDRWTITTDVAGGRRRLCRPLERPQRETTSPLERSIDLPIEYVPPYALLDPSAGGGALVLYRCGRGPVRTLAHINAYVHELNRLAAIWSTLERDRMWIYLLRSGRRFSWRLPFIGEGGRIALTREAVLAQSGKYPGPYRLLTRSLAER